MNTFIILFGIVLYLAPSIAGWNTRGCNGILILNIFLGWTIIGWIAALIWAVQSPEA